MNDTTTTKDFDLDRAMADLLADLPERDIYADLLADLA